jgi:Calcineurin-like phosphoesterase.
MYSGGHGFFNWLRTDPRFAKQQGCSYFLLENKLWQLFGLDSAYGSPDRKGNIGNIYGGQIAWMAQERARAPEKKCVLLTHHQPFSAFDEVNAALEDQLRPLARRNQISAWFWGHEHYCAVYDCHNNIPYPILLGHGGFPERRKPLRAGAPSLDFDWNFVDAGEFVIFGFAVLDFNADQIAVRLIDVNGDPRYHFVIN